MPLRRALWSTVSHLTVFLHCTVLRVRPSNLPVLCLCLPRCRLFPFLNTRKPQCRVKAGLLWGVVVVYSQDPSAFADEGFLPYARFWLLPLGFNHGSLAGQILRKTCTVGVAAPTSGSSRAPVTPVPGDPTPSSGPYRCQYRRGIYFHTGAHMHISKELNK